MQELPVYSPDAQNRGRALSAQYSRFLEAEKKKPGRFKGAFEELRHRCIRETLRLTGVRVSAEEVSKVLREGHTSRSVNHDLIVGQKEALAIIEKAATTGSKLDSLLLCKVHRLSSPPSGGCFRRGPVQSQFENVSPSRARDISYKVNNLADWLDSESVRGMQAPEKAALAFVRLLEIAPFANGNFRSSHLILNYFAFGGGYPPFFVDCEDSEEFRRDIERAFKLETKHLVDRLAVAQMTSLQYCLEAATC